MLFLPLGGKPVKKKGRKVQLRKRTLGQVGWAGRKEEYGYQPLKDFVAGVFPHPRTQA
jgi:hypothetical protein